MIEYRNAGGIDNDVSDAYIIACIVITSLVTLCILVLILLHNFYWKRKYHKYGHKSKEDLKFDHKAWYNDVCDQYYFNEV
jgi:hypothetical protein